MRAECEFLECVNQLEKCVKQIKAISRKLEETISLDVRDGIKDMEQGLEKIEHSLAEEIEETI